MDSYLNYIIYVFICLQTGPYMFTFVIILVLNIPPESSYKIIWKFQLVINIMNSKTSQKLNKCGSLLMELHFFF